MTGIARVIAAGVFVLLHAGTAAAARTDVVVLANGDRITGEVQSVSRGQLRIKTDDAGTVTVNWTKVAALSTAAAFDVGTGDGRRFVGRLDTTPAGQLAVIGTGGAPTVTLAVRDIVSLAPIRARFLRKIDGSVNLGASYTRASGVAQLSFDGTATYRQPSFAASTQAAIALTRDPDAPDTARYSLLFDYTRFRPNLWLVHPMALIERNTDLGFDLRTTGAVTIGRYLVQSNRGMILLAGGAAVGKELPVDASALTNVDALIAFNASLFAYDFPKTDIDLATLVFPSLNDAGRVRVNANARFKREVLRNVYFAVTAYDAFDNRPPSSAASKNDVGFSLSLGWSF